MSKKRIVSFITAAAMLFTLCTTGVFAQQISEISYEADDNFDTLEVSASGTLDGWDTLNTPVLSAVSGNGKGTALKITADAAAESLFNGISKTISVAAENEYIEIAFDAKAEAAGEIPAVYFAASDAAGIAMWFADGKLYTGSAMVDGQHVGEYAQTPGQWFGVRIRINGYNNTYSVSINGEDIAANKVPSADGKKVSTKEGSEFDLRTASVIGFVNAAKGGDGVVFDNVSIRRLVRDDYKPAQNFRTDFSELKGYGELPNGFKIPFVFSQIGGKVIDAQHGPSLSLKGASAADSSAGISKSGTNICSKMLFRDKVTSGKLIIEFDGYIENPASDATFFGVVYAYPESDLSTNGTVLLRNKNTAVLDSTYTNGVETPAGSWGHYKIEINFADKTKAAWYNGTQIETAMDLDANLQGGISGFCFKNNSGANKEDRVWNIDNLSITTVPPAAASESYTLTDDFESYASPADALAAWPKGGGALTADNINLDKDGTGNQSLYISRAQSDSSKWVNRETQQINAGIVSLKYSVKTDSGEVIADTMLTTGAGGSAYFLPITSLGVGIAAAGVNTNLATFSTTDKRYIGTVEANKWYDVDAEIDMTNRRFSVTVTDKETNAEVGTVSNLSFDDCAKLTTSGVSYDFTSIEDIRFRVLSYAKADETNGAYLDDVLLTYTPEKPSVSPEKTELVKHDGTAEENTASASPAIGEIRIDFGGTMDTESLLEKVSITNVTKGEAVKYDGEVNGSVFSMKLPNMLEPNTEYKISVPHDTMTAGSTELGTADFEFLFSTNAGELSASLNSVKIGSAAVGAKADITSGSIAETSIKYFNSMNTSNDVYLIFGYYKGGALIRSSYRYIPLGSDIKNITLNHLERISADADEADNVKVFLWNGMDEIYPLDRNLDFK